MTKFIKDSNAGKSIPQGDRKVIIETHLPTPAGIKKSEINSETPGLGTKPIERGTLDTSK